MTYHANAKTNLHQRMRIRKSKAPYRTQSRELGVSVATVTKWKRRKDPKDRTSRPHKIYKAIPKEMRPILKALRQDWFLDLDTVWKALQNAVLPQLSRSSVYRELVRLGLQRLKAQEPRIKHGKFKASPPGFLHIDVFYLPRLDGKKRYLYVAIDRATRLLTMQVHDQRSAECSCLFLEHCKKFYPFRIWRILTDNGGEFTNTCLRVLPHKVKVAHPFLNVCQEARIHHVLTKPFHPWTNGLAERTGQTIKSHTVWRFHYETSAQLDSALYGFERYFNYHRPYKVMQGKTPYELVQEWHKKQPNRFFRKPTMLITTW